ncbi:unnamed protein product [Closterium sp. NIES-64]|nr:unnamed protein product [Closterium sp. NIES-64]
MEGGMAEATGGGDWRALLEAACADDRRGGEQEAARRQLQALVRGGHVALSDVLGGMGPHLTTADGALRARGTALLAALVEAMLNARRTALLAALVEAMLAVPLPPPTLATLARYFALRMVRPIPPQLACTPLVLLLICRPPPTCSSVAHPPLAHLSPTPHFLICRPPPTCSSVAHPPLAHLSPTPTCSSVAHPPLAHLSPTPHLLICRPPPTCSSVAHPPLAHLSPTPHLLICRPPPTCSSVAHPPLAHLSPTPHLLICRPPPTCSSVPHPPLAHLSPTPHLLICRPPPTCSSVAHPPLAHLSPTPHLLICRPPPTCSSVAHPPLAHLSPTPHLLICRPPPTCSSVAHPPLAHLSPTPHLLICPPPPTCSSVAHPPLAHLSPTPHLLICRPPPTCSSVAHPPLAHSSPPLSPVHLIFIRPLPPGPPLPHLLTRQADWPCVRGALAGALALLQRGEGVGAVAGGDAGSMAAAVVEVHVQALPQADRMGRWDAWGGDAWGGDACWHVCEGRAVCSLSELGSPNFSPTHPPVRPSLPLNPSFAPPPSRHPPVHLCLPFPFPPPTPTPQLALQVLRALLERHLAAAPSQAQKGVGKRAEKGGVQWAGLAGGVVAVVDGEKDPRCLLQALRIVALLMGALHREGGSAAVGAVAEDLFDVVSAYFPVSFSPPPNDPRGITREDLVQALLGAFQSTPLFAPMAIPLLLDKLSSSFTTAKLDSLRFLTACATAWGPHAIAPHAPAIWHALIPLLPALHAPPSLSTSPTPSPSAPSGSDPEMSAAAVQCVVACVRATLPRCSSSSEGGSAIGGEPAHPSVLAVMLEDERVLHVGGLLAQGGREKGEGWGEAREEGMAGVAGMAGRVRAAGELLASVAHVSPSASSAVSAALLPPLLRLLLPPSAHGQGEGGSNAGRGEKEGGEGGESEMCRAVQRELMQPRGMMALDVLVSLIRAARDVAQEEWEQEAGDGKRGTEGGNEGERGKGGEARRGGERADVTVVAERERLLLLFRSALALAVAGDSHGAEEGQGSSSGAREQRRTARCEEAAALGVAGLECLVSFPPSFSPLSPALLSRAAALITHSLVHLPLPPAHHATTTTAAVTATTTHSSTAHTTAPQHPSKTSSTARASLLATPIAPASSPSSHPQPFSPPLPPPTPPLARCLVRALSCLAHAEARWGSAERGEGGEGDEEEDGGRAGGEGSGGGSGEGDGSGDEEDSVSVREVVLPLLAVVGEEVMGGRSVGAEDTSGGEAEEAGAERESTEGGDAGRVMVCGEALAAVVGEVAAARHVVLPALSGLALRACSAHPIVQLSALLLPALAKPSRV